MKSLRYFGFLDKSKRGGRTLYCKQREREQEQGTHTEERREQEEGGGGDGFREEGGVCGDVIFDEEYHANFDVVYMLHFLDCCGNGPGRQDDAAASR